MAVLSKTAFLTKWAALFADNTTGDISEQDIRDFRQDISDSFLNISDDLLDEDDMASNSATKTATQQSIKAYVDAEVAGAGDEHFLGVYADETALTTAHATASPGDYAYIDAGVASPVEMWIWDDDDDEWVQSGGAAGGTWGSITGTLSSQTDLQSALDAKAPLASPTFTGTPAAPTPAAATKTTRLATTEFVLTEMPYSVAASDEVTPITASDRITFPWPFPGTTTLVNVIGFLATPQTIGSIFTIDIEKNGTTILSTLLTIDNTEYNSTTAATPVVISVPSIAFMDRITIVVTQIGDSTAKGLKLIFVR